MKVLVIVNPAAGQGRSEALLTSITAAFERNAQSRSVQTVLTGGPGEGEILGRQAAESGSFDAVFVAGGDGTVNEVVNGLLAGRTDGIPAPMLGIIPTGTQNVLAHELGMPFGSAAAAALLESGHTRVIDLGRAERRYFAVMAGFGFDAAVIRDVVGPVKDLIGPAAYAFAALGALATYRSSRVRLTLDEEEIVTNAYLVVVANGASYAYRQIKLAPYAAMDDGWLDVCVFERAPTDRVGFATQMMAVLARRHLRDPRVRYYRARQIEIDSSPPIQGQLDGEMFRATPLRIEVVPGALTVLVPG